jgi:hypothetical protein
MNEDSKQAKRKYSKHVKPEDKSRKSRVKKVAGGRERKTERMLK